MPGLAESSELPLTLKTASPACYATSKTTEVEAQKQERQLPSVSDLSSQEGAPRRISSASWAQATSMAVFTTVA